MSTVVHDPPRSYDWALLILRVVVGVIFFAHGLQKITSMGLTGFGDALASMGVPLAGVLGPVVTLGELLGGVALILGLLTRVVGAGLAIDMLGAIALVHLPGGFFAPDGIEFVMLLCAANLAFLIAGAGRYSIDGLLRGRRHGLAPAGVTGAGTARRVA